MKKSADSKQKEKLNMSCAQSQKREQLYLQRCSPCL